MSGAPLALPRSGPGLGAACASRGGTVSKRNTQRQARRPDGPGAVLSRQYGQVSMSGMFFRDVDGCSRAA
jgi:hypothetical protein